MRTPATRYDAASRRLRRVRRLLYTMDSPKSDVQAARLISILKEEVIRFRPWTAADERRYQQQYFRDF